MCVAYAVNITSQMGCDKCLIHLKELRVHTTSVLVVSVLFRQRRRMSLWRRLGVIPLCPQVIPNFHFFWFNFLYLYAQQRVKSASSAEHMKLLAAEMSNADSNFQQLDKLRMIYEEHVKLKKESIPLTEKNLKELREDLTQKSQAFDDVSFSVWVLWLCSFFSYFCIAFVHFFFPVVHF